MSGVEPSSFEREGYTLLHGLLPPAVVAECRQLVRSQYSKLPWLRDGQGLVAPAMLEAAAFRPLLPLVVETLNRQALHTALRAALNETRRYVLADMAEVQVNRSSVWHRDVLHKHEERAYRSPQFADLWAPGYGMARLIVYLEDHEDHADLGGLQVYPGSHRQPACATPPSTREAASPCTAARKRSLPHGVTLGGTPADNEAPHLHTRAGDGVLFDMRLVHRGTHYVSAAYEDRISLQLTFGADNGWTAEWRAGDALRRSRLVQQLKVVLKPPLRWDSRPTPCNATDPSLPLFVDTHTPESPLSSPELEERLRETDLANLTETLGLPYGLSASAVAPIPLRAETVEALPVPPYPDLARRGTCAVVGSSGLLRGAALGRLIDSHDVVVRVNGAPARGSGYEADVGARTTIRLLHVAEFSSPSMLDARLLRDDSERVLVSLTHPAAYERVAKYILGLNGSRPCDGTMRSCKKVASAAPWAPLPSSHVVSLEPRRVALLNPAVWARTNALVGAKAWRASRPTTGAVALVFALHFCERVSAFGFSWGSRDRREEVHYYHRGGNLSQGCSGRSRICGRVSSQLHSPMYEQAFFRELLESGQLVTWQPAPTPDLLLVRSLSRAWVCKQKVNDVLPPLSTPFSHARMNTSTLAVGNSEPSLGIIGGSVANAALAFLANDKARVLRPPVTSRSSMKLVVPGHGEPARVPILQRSLERLRRSAQNSGLRSSCEIFSYRQTNLTTDWCTVIRRPGLWTDFMKAVELGVDEEVVLLLMDDVEIDPTFDLSRFLCTMRTLGLDVASAAIPERHLTIMLPNASCAARRTSYVDILFVAFTRRAWYAGIPQADLRTCLPQTHRPC